MSTDNKELCEELIESQVKEGNGDFQNEGELPEQTEPSLQSILASEKYRENSLVNAQYIEKQMKGNWFVASQLIDIGFPEDQLTGTLDILTLFGYVFRAERNGVLSFKITIGDEERLATYQRELESKKLEIVVLEQQILILTNKISTNNSLPLPDTTA